MKKCGLIYFVGCLSIFFGVMYLSTVQAKTSNPMKITSPAFKNNETMPVKYALWGENVNPPLNIDGIPEGAKSLALIVDDPDAPTGMWVHWVVFNMPLITAIKENAHPGGIQGRNDFTRMRYDGPCPPSGTHRYFFKIYALDSLLDIPRGTEKKLLEKAMQGHILAQAELIGLCDRQSADEGARRVAGKDQ